MTSADGEVQKGEWHNDNHVQTKEERAAAAKAKREAAAKAKADAAARKKKAAADAQLKKEQADPESANYKPKSGF
jgi:hypothetical protein